MGFQLRQDCTAQKELNKTIPKMRQGIRDHYNAPYNPLLKTAEVCRK